MFLKYNPMSQTKSKVQECMLKREKLKKKNKQKKKTKNKKESMLCYAMSVCLFVGSPKMTFPRLMA